MNGQTLAHVRRILTGSDRALIHAVTGAGHEHKLEVPAERSTASSRTRASC
jgi:hypothetical protein